MAKCHCCGAPLKRGENPFRLTSQACENFNNPEKMHDYLEKENERKRRLIGALVIVICIILGGGFFAFQYFIAFFVCVLGILIVGAWIDDPD